MVFTIYRKTFPSSCVILLMAWQFEEETVVASSEKILSPMKVRVGKMKRPRFLLTGLVIIAASISAIVVVPIIQVCRDWGFVCEYTGSRKGYREWFLGFETGHWYRESPMEKLIMDSDPGDLVHRWESYCGTGKNILGMPILFGHGRPGAIRQFDYHLQSLWISHNSPTDVRDLYDLLLSGDEAAIKHKIGDIQEEVLNYSD